MRLFATVCVVCIACMASAEEIPSTTPAPIAKDERLPRGEHTDAEASAMVRRLARIVFPISEKDLFEKLKIDKRKLNQVSSSFASNSDGSGSSTQRHWVSKHVEIVLTARWARRGDAALVAEAKLVDHATSFEFQPSELLEKPATKKEKWNDQEIKVAGVLTGIARAVDMNSRDRDGFAPDDLAGIEDFPGQFAHPAQDVNATNNEKQPFIYLGRGLRVTAVRQPSRYIVAYERKRYARNGEICLAFLDGHVSFFKIDVAEKIIRHQNDVELEN